MNEPRAEQRRQLLRELHEHVDRIEKSVLRMDAIDERSKLIDCILEFRNSVTELLAEKTSPYSRVKPTNA